MQWNQYTPLVPPFALTKTIIVKTGENGVFFAHGKCLNGVSIYNINKIGYDSSVNRVVNMYFRSGHDGSLYHTADSYFHMDISSYTDLRRVDTKDPVVFRMRKKGEEAFVMNNGNNGWEEVFSYSAGESGIRKGCDFPRGVVIPEKDFATPQHVDGLVELDLTSQATRDPKTGVWTYVLTATGEGGLLLHDQLLYAAPAEGYQKSLTFTAGPGEHPLNKYLYLRLRSSRIYARMKLSGMKVFRGYDGREVFLLMKQTVCMNPYGERNLEAATDLPGEVEIALEHEAWKAFRLCQLPPKPDLKQRVRDWEKKRPVLEKVKAWINR